MLDSININMISARKSSYLSSVCLWKNSIEVHSIKNNNEQANLCTSNIHLAVPLDLGPVWTVIFFIWIIRFWFSGVWEPDLEYMHCTIMRLLENPCVKYYIFYILLEMNWRIENLKITILLPRKSLCEILYILHIIQILLIIQKFYRLQVKGKPTQQSTQEACVVLCSWAAFFDGKSLSFRVSMLFT